MDNSTNYFLLFGIALGLVFLWIANKVSAGHTNPVVMAQKKKPRNKKHKV
jgi:hypothetical protein